MSQRGFTLVELLVALCIASVGIAGGVGALSPVLAAWHAAQVQERLHERALYVFATLEPELQMAGYWGTDPLLAWPRHAGISPSLAACGPALPALAEGLSWLPGPWPLSCAAQGGGAATGAVMVIRRAAAIASAPELGRVQLLDSESAPASRQLRWDGVVPEGAASVPDLEWRDLLLRAYYVARQSDGDAGTPALRVKSLTAVAGRPAFVDTEVMPGVAELSVELLPGVDRQAGARVRLVVQADSTDARTGQPPARLTLTRDFALRNAPQS